MERVEPSMLCEEGLYINKSKTDKYHISKCRDAKLKSCKYLGLLIRTEEDIDRRKVLTHDNYHALESIEKQACQWVRWNQNLQSIHWEYLPLQFWFMDFNQHTSKIHRFFSLETTQVIHLTWPRVITNEELYKRTKVTPWSLTICKRRVS